MRRRGAASDAARSMAGRAPALGNTATASRQWSGPHTTGASSSPPRAATRIAFKAPARPCT
eukprot:4722774-Lingulodinium_polyedra.AAC.1